MVAQMVKNLPTIQETWVQSLGQEDTLEKGLATHSSILTWEFRGERSQVGLQSMGSQRIRNDWVTNAHTHTHTRTHWLIFYSIASFHDRSAGNNPPAMQETQKTWVQSLGYPGGGNDNWIQNSWLKNPMDREARQAAVRGVAKSPTQLSD